MGKVCQMYNTVVSSSISPIMPLILCCLSFRPSTMTAITIQNNNLPVLYVRKVTLKTIIQQLLNASIILLLLLLLVYILYYILYTISMLFIIALYTICSFMWQIFGKKKKKEKMQIILLPINTQVWEGLTALYVLDSVVANFT